MRIIRDIKDMQNYIRRIRQTPRITIGFVPTMGYLHEGHLSLIRKADRENNIVVVSIFVNPVQFGPKEDYRRYPRDIDRDKRLAESAGVDCLFNPSAQDMYPFGFDTYVETKNLSLLLCGKFRPWHFKGVTTVVAKLFNIVKPDIAYFGQKDYQQAVIIKRMAQDLNMDTKIKLLPIVREKDGLAMSSRNIYLSPKERKDAIIIYQALRYAKRLIGDGERDSKKIIKAVSPLIEDKRKTKIDYVSIVDSDTLEERDKISGRVVITAAVWVGKTRLIDNIICYALC